MTHPRHSTQKGSLINLIKFIVPVVLIHWFAQQHGVEAPGHLVFAQLKSLIPSYSHPEHAPYHPSMFKPPFLRTEWISERWRLLVPPCKRQETPFRRKPQFLICFYVPINTEKGNLSFQLHQMDFLFFSNSNGTGWDGPRVHVETQEASKAEQRHSSF